MASGVSDVASLVLLLLRRCRRRHHHRRRRRGTITSLLHLRGRWVRRVRWWERRCRRSVRRDGIVVDDDAADKSPDAAATATNPDGSVGGGSSTDRDDNDHDTNGDHRHCRRPRPRWAATAVAMMTIAGERGGEATARRRGKQGDDKVTEMRRQSAMVPALARLIEFLEQVQG